MSDFQDNKALVRNYYEALDAAEGDEINAVIRAHTTDDYLWRGMHLFYEQHSANDVANVFWKPFRDSFTSIQRRQPAGKHAIGYVIKKTGASSGSVTLMIDDKAVGELDLTQMWPTDATNSGLRCGENQHAPISRVYKPPYKFSGNLKRVVVDVDLPVA